MKIVFCNKYFFMNGGTERYLYNIMNYLSDRGHTAIPFSVRYAHSWPSAWQDYFLAPPGDPEQAHLGNIQFSVSNILRFLDRSTYSIEARIKLNRLLSAAGGADIAYILNIYNYMSPSIIHTFKQHRIPVVIQTGDYNLLCPSYTLLRNGKTCTLCVQGDYYHGLKYRCVKNHLAASFVRVAAMYIQRWMGVYQLVDAIVVPCEFMKNMLINSGFPGKKIYLHQYPVERRQGERSGKENRQKTILDQQLTDERRQEIIEKEETRIQKIHILQYPVEHTTVPDKAWHKKNYIVYFGRISYEKGLDTLISAFQQLNPEPDLLIIGRSYDGEEKRLKQMIQPHFKDRIHFIGFQTGQTLRQLITEALFSVVPSRWYDNAPLAIYESFLNGTPVLGARIGGIPEQIQEGVTGLLFEPDSSDDLMQKMNRMLSDRKQLIQMGIAGQSYVKENLLIKDQMDGLMNLFETVIADYNRR
ncbi:MAG: glycosyltransferase family 4 protein [Desulfatirhabdiaceae bacterium]